MSAGSGNDSEPTLPNDGRPQPHKGANPDAKMWKAVSMHSNPTLFKIVDEKDTNVADQFHSQANAEQYVAFYIWKQSQQPQQGSSTTRDGVVVPFKIKGAWDYTVKEDWRDGGARFNMAAKGTSVVMVGAFTATQDGGDEVSAKMLGGRHNNDAPFDGCIYDLGIKVNGKQPRMRAECPHPDYTDTLSTGTDGLTFVGRWTLMMAAAIQETNGVRIQYFQDQGSAETNPANQWKKLYEFFDDGTKISGIEGADRFPLRKLPSTGAQNTWRIDHTPGLKQKWLAIAEIDVSSQ